MSTQTSNLKPNSMLNQTAFMRLVSAALMGSAIAAAVGIVFLLLFFSGVGGYFGTLNDIAVVIHYILLLPIMIYVHRVIPVNGSTRLIQILGFSGTLAVIVLQTMLVINLLPFQRQIVLVIPAFLVVTAWFAITEQMGKAEPHLPKGRAQAILAGLVFGYPFWALNFRKRLNTGMTAVHPQE